MAIQFPWARKQSIDLEECSDAVLMERLCKSGEHLAFQALYVRYGKRILAFLHRMLPGKPDLVEDLLQETFAKVWENPGSYTPGRPLAPWLFTIAANLAKNEWRKMNVRAKVHSGESAQEQHQIRDSAPNQERLVDLQQFNTSLQKALNQLEEAHREVFLLRYQQEFSVKEISEALQVPEGTVKSRLFYASKKLAAMLQHLQNLKSESL